MPVLQCILLFVASFNANHALLPSSLLPSSLVKKWGRLPGIKVSSGSIESTDMILSIIAGTDSGAEAKPEIKMMVDGWIMKKSEEYAQRLIPGQTALDDPNIYGNYNVSFVGVGGNQRGNPAGGRYRGFLGRLLYKNDGLYQHILKDEGLEKGTAVKVLAINNVRGRLLRLIPLSIVLRGVVKSITDERRANLTARFGTKLTSSAVRAEFEPPFISIGGLTLQVGPPSSVVLDTPYVDEQIRLGVGSRGSTFIFARTADAASYLWKTELARRPLKGRRVGAALLCAAALLHIVTKSNTLLNVLSRFLTLPMGLIALLLLLSKGGIIDEREDP